MQKVGDDPILRKRLESARKKVPKYLFRMWRPASGGNPKLNSTKKVVPHAFHYSIGHDSMFEMTQQDMIETVRGHLDGEKIKATEFSSWTASLLFALRYATYYDHETWDPYIAIIDTDKLPNSIFHVPAWCKIFSSTDPEFGQYHEEYLVHHVVIGEGYRAVSFGDLLSEGLARQLPRFDMGVSPWVNRGEIGSDITPVTRDEVHSLRRIAKLYGKDFYIPLTIALISLKKRSPNFDFTEEEVSTILSVLHRKNIPDWGGCQGVMGDDIYDKRYEDNRQMVYLMRALHAQCYGRRGRRRAATASFR